MPHPQNVEALSELLFRAEHLELGLTPAFELLPESRKELYRRRATFLSNRGVLVPSAVATELERAVEQSGAPGQDRIETVLERIARGP